MYRIQRPGPWSKIWAFPKISGTLFWGPYNKDPTIQATIVGSHIFGNSHIKTLYITLTPTPSCPNGGSLHVQHRGTEV